MTSLLLAGHRGTIRCEKTYAEEGFGMCLAVPGKVLSVDEGGCATVDMLGAQREVSLRLVPDAQVGDYVLVHAGFGIQVVDPEEARETIELVKQLPELLEEDAPVAGEAMGALA